MNGGYCRTSVRLRLTRRRRESGARGQARTAQSVIQTRLITHPFDANSASAERIKADANAEHRRVHQKRERLGRVLNKQTSESGERARRVPFQTMLRLAARSAAHDENNAATRNRIAATAGTQSTHVLDGVGGHKGAVVQRGVEAALLGDWGAHRPQPARAAYTSPWSALNSPHRDNNHQRMFEVGEQHPRRLNDTG
jgi:hypothetical protein